jgi:hypothetical protein
LTLDDRRPDQAASPPGLFASIGATRDAGKRLAIAHVDLAKAEAKAIGGQLVRTLAFAGIALGVLLLASILLVVGGALFLGEWLLGSLGWGLLDGLLLFAAIALACGLAALGVAASRIGRAFVGGFVVAIVASIVLGLAIPNTLYAQVGDQAFTAIEPGVRPLLVGVLIWATLGLLVGLIGAWRSGGGGGAWIGGALGGLVVGAIVGALTAIDVGAQVGVGIGIAIGYIVWIDLMVIDIVRTGIDMDALKARFYPSQTIDTSKETLAWLQSRMPPGTGS